MEHPLRKSNIMNQKTWPNPPPTHPFSNLHFTSDTKRKSRGGASSVSTTAAASSTFSLLPDDVLLRISCTFKFHDVQSASLVCKSWSRALAPLREAMLLMKWGRRFKHGKGGVSRNLDKALDSFLKGAARGSTLAMVDAGLACWDMGRVEDGVDLYRRAAELGDPAGQCNLAISYLKAEPPEPKEAVKWLYFSSRAGYARAQYQLALCLHQGHGVDRSLPEAARWYLKAAEGGYVRAMYNVSLCFSVGEGVSRNYRLAKKWMRRAAERGHNRAQYEHGLSLFSEGQMIDAAVYLELASRAGENAAAHVRDVILQQHIQITRDVIVRRANNWRSLPQSSRAA